VIALLAIASGACGKKGPPLAPLVPIPAAVTSIEARRVGSEVFITLGVPAANIDEHTPADLERVEVYGYTGRSAPPRARWVELATLVATVPVTPPPPKPGEEQEAPPAASKPLNAPLQGAKITVRDVLTPDELIQGKEPPVVRDVKSSETETRPADREPRIPELKRFYTAVGFNARNRPGPPGGVAEFTLVPMPDAPPSVEARYTERAIRLNWEPAGGLLGFLLDRPLPEETVPFDLDENDGSIEPPGPVSYQVYREILPDTMSPPGPGAANWREEPLLPLTPLPVTELQFVDSIEFDKRRCYTVRAVRGTGPGARVGDSSPPACLTAIDVFPPAPPKSLATVASEGAISLIWEPNTELDLGGYIVLRGEAPGDTLHPLTAAPVVEAGYRDEAVTSGVRYVYAVIAVDNRLPLPNVSVESSRTEETAR
jgi:hypothetical protein